MNGDLWHSVFSALDARRGRTHVYKIKSHLTAADVDNGTISERDLYGNALADVAAGRGPEEFFQPPAEAIQRYERWAAITFLICRRLAAIEALHHRLMPDGGPRYIPNVLPVPEVHPVSELRQQLSQKMDISLCIRTAGPSVSAAAGGNDPTTSRDGRVLNVAASSARHRLPRTKKCL